MTFKLEGSFIQRIGVAQIAKERERYEEKVRELSVPPIPSQCWCKRSHMSQKDWQILSAAVTKAGVSAQAVVQADCITITGTSIHHFVGCVMLGDGDTPDRCLVLHASSNGQSYKGDGERLHVGLRAFTRAWNEWAAGDVEPLENALLRWAIDYEKSILGSRVNDPVAWARKTGFSVSESFAILDRDTDIRLARMVRALASKARPGILDPVEGEGRFDNRPFILSNCNAEVLRETPADGPLWQVHINVSDNCGRQREVRVIAPDGLLARLWEEAVVMVGG